MAFTAAESDGCSGHRGENRGNPRCRWRCGRGLGRQRKGRVRGLAIMKPERLVAGPRTAGRECMDGKDRRKDWVRARRGPPGWNGSAYFGGRGYEMHRHDTYAIGRTLSGVQSFHYRRGLRHSCPAARWCCIRTRRTTGRPAPTRFAIACFMSSPPWCSACWAALPCRAVCPTIRACARLPSRCCDDEQALDPLEEADALRSGARWPPSPASAAVAALDYGAAERARQRIHDGLAGRLTLADLEAASGRDRWSLSRDFRARTASALSLCHAASVGCAAG